MRKFKIVENAAGKFKLEVRAEGVSDLWVSASPEEFKDLTSAEAGIKRIIEKREWYYDARGHPCR